VSAVEVSPESRTLEEERRRGIGGTDVAAILGLHPWKTAHDVWLDKMGLADPLVSEPAYWGTVLEPILGREYALRRNVEVYRPEPRLFVHTQHPWMIGHPDYLVSGEATGLDCKTTGVRQAHRWGPEGTDEIPEEALLQAQWYLLIAGDRADRWDIAALIGQEFRTYTVRPQAKLQGMMIDLAGDFWMQYVQTQTPPPVDHTEAARKMLQKVFPHDLGMLRPATDAEQQLAEQYREILARLDTAEIERDLVGNQIRQAIGDDVGIEGDFGRITWKRTKDREHTDWKAIATALWTEIQFHGAWDRDLLGVLQIRHTESKPGVRRFLPQFIDNERGKR